MYLCLSCSAHAYSAVPRLSHSRRHSKLRAFGKQTGRSTAFLFAHRSVFSFLSVVSRLTHTTSRVGCSCFDSRTLRPTNRGHLAHIFLTSPYFRRPAGRGRHRPYRSTHGRRPQTRPTPPHDVPPRVDKRLPLPRVFRDRVHHPEYLWLCSRLYMIIGMVPTHITHTSRPLPLNIIALHASQPAEIYQSRRP